MLRLPSGEIRHVDVRCRATIGEVGNAEQSNINWGKAGRMRVEGQAPHRSRCRNEPGRPPARWW
jgi:large subunit ribosomal protein L2